MRYFVADIYKLALTLKDDTTDNKRTENERRKANASAKAKELQPKTQSQRFAAHLLLPRPHDIPILSKLTRTKQNNGDRY